MATKFLYRRRVTLAGMLANLNRHDFEADSLEELLYGIRGMIQKSTKRMNALDDSDDDRGPDIVAEENKLIDSLLGCAFVLCQTHITAIAIGVVLAGKRGLQINGAGERNTAIKLGTGASQKIIASIELAANYFKHNEEWMTKRQGKGGNQRRVWIKTAGLQKDKKTPKDVPGRKTIGLAEKIGLAPGESNNISTLAALLEINASDDYEGLPALAGKLKVWHAEMLDIVANAPEIQKAP